MNDMPSLPLAHDFKKKKKQRQSVILITCQHRGALYRGLERYQYMYNDVDSVVQL